MLSSSAKDNPLSKAPERAAPVLVFEKDNSEDSICLTGSSSKILSEKVILSFYQ